MAARGGQASVYGSVDPMLGDFPALRTATSNTFPDRQHAGFKTVAASQPVNYKDARGKWQPIDDTMVADGQPGFAFRNKADSYSAELPPTLAGSVRVTSGQFGVGFSLAGAGGGRGVAAGQSVRYAGALPDTDVVYTATPAGLKEDLVLRDPSAPGSVTYRLAPTGGLSVAAGQGGEVDFVDTSGVTRMVIPAPVVWDGSGPRAASTTAARFVLSPDGRAVSLQVDPAWLASPDRVWPVTVDPNLTDFTNNTTLTCNLVQAAPSTSSCDATTLNVGFDGVNATRAVTTFELSSIPHASTVENASLYLQVDTHSNATTTNVGVYQLTQPFTTAATWNTYDGSHPWTSPGGDFTSAGFVTSNLGSGSGYYWFPTQLVQGWVEGSTANDGLIIKEPTESAATQFDFWSSTSSTPSGYAPKLAVYWQPRVGLFPYYTQLTQQIDDRTTINVNPATGNLEMVAKDVAVNGAGQQLTVDRYSSSLISGFGQFAPQASSVDGSWCSAGTDETFSENYGGTNQQGGGSLEEPDCSVAAFPTTNDAGPLQMPAGLNVSYSSVSGNDTLTFNRTGEVVTFDNTYGSNEIAADADRSGEQILYDRINGSYPPSPSQITDSEGRVFPWTFDTTNDVTTQIQDSTGGRAVTYNYGSGGYPLNSYTDENNQTTSYGYQSIAPYDLNSITSPAGGQSTMVYDSVGRVTSITRVTNQPAAGDGDTWTFTYNQDAGDAAGNTVVTDPNGHQTKYVYNVESQVTSVVDANGNTTQNTYNANFDTNALTNGVSQVTTLNYDSNNNLTSLVDPPSGTGATAATWTNAYKTSSTTKGYTYLPSSSTTPQGVCTAYTYDPNGVMTNVYDGQASNCDGQTGGAHYTNNLQGDNGVASCTSDGLTTTYPGLLCATIYPNQASTANTVAYSYTVATTTPKLLQKVNIVQPGGTCTTPRKLCQTVTFDPDSRVQSVQDSSSANSGAGTLATYCYDNDDRVTKVFYTAPASPPACTSAATITFTYDANGNLTQRIDPTGTTSYGYDTLNRVVTQNTGTNTCSATVYNPTAVTYQGTVCFAYDGANNLTGYTDTSGTTNYYYDPGNRVTSLVEPGGTTGCAVAGKVTKTLCTAFSYNNANQRTETLYPGGATLTAGYDNAGNQTSAMGTANAGGTPITSFTNCYQTLISGSCPTNGARSDRTQVQQLVEADTHTSATTDYLYDANGRLCSAANAAGGTCTAPPAGANAYTYDQAGNRTQQTVAGTTSYFMSNPDNQLCWKAAATTSSCSTIPTGATTYTYDNNGNLASTANPTASYSYNNQNQTTATTDNGVSLSSMAYADLGQTQRTSYTQGTTTTTLLNTPLGVDKISTGANTAYTIRDPYGNLIGYKDASGNHWYYLLDPHGSVIAVINNNGATIGTRYAYNEYGQTTYTQTNPIVTQPWGYTSGYTDPTTLIKYGNRYYDPILGRWTQQDSQPMGLANTPGSDLYLYAGADPINQDDPTGNGFWMNLASAAIGSLVGSVAYTVCAGLVIAAGGGPEDPVGDFYGVTGCAPVGAATSVSVSSWLSSYL
ncbi:MAG TPA: DNRLRE domain-containing protein [Acidimicrobiales bacterium]|nr:DNRLRE domain-containing protein [Acidimicrobiales bacterium]